MEMETVIEITTEGSELRINLTQASGFYYSIVINTIDGSIVRTEFKKSDEAMVLLIKKFEDISINANEINTTYFNIRYILKDDIISEIFLDQIQNIPQVIQVSTKANLTLQNIDLRKLLLYADDTTFRGLNCMDNLASINADIKNGGILNTKNIIFKHIKFFNSGTWNQNGDIETENFKFNNGGQTVWNNVHWNTNKRIYGDIYNHNTWTFNNCSNTNEIFIHSFRTLYFENSKLKFSWLIGRNITFKSGQYNIDALQNNGTINFIENNWIMTDDINDVGENYLYYNNKGYGPVGKLNSEKHLEIKTNFDISQMTASQKLILEQQKIVGAILEQRKIVDARQLYQNIECFINKYLN